MANQPSFLQTDQQDDVLFVRLVGKVLLDPMAVEELGSELLSLIDRQKPHKMVVSFADVGRCSTDVINALLVAKKRLLTQGGEMKLCEMSENIRYTYRILNLDGTVFRIYDSPEDALEAFALDSTA